MDIGIDLNVTWFLLVGALFTGYAVLDGFDLGVGALHLLVRKDEDRRLMINAIGPVWDGNEVWLVAAGGCLFAAFPRVYAAVFSGLYVPFVCLLFALIFRAVGIEFRSKQPMKGWRTFWDVSFSISSILLSLLVGVVLGNLVWGMPVTSEGELEVSFLNLLHPYSLLVGLTTVALFMMHGAVYVVLKTEGALRDRARGWARNTFIFFGFCYIAVTAVTLLYAPHMTETMKAHPVLFLIPLVSLLAIVNVPREIYRGRDFRAFLSSCAAVVMLLLLFGLGMFPNLVLSRPNPEMSLTIYNAASSERTLSVMLVMALIGMPLVAAYTAGVYWVFRGKVKIDATSY